MKAKSLGVNDRMSSVNVRLRCSQRLPDLHRIRLEDLGQQLIVIHPVLRQVDGSHSQLRRLLLLSDDFGCERVIRPSHDMKDQAHIRNGEDSSYPLQAARNPAAKSSDMPTHQELIFRETVILIR
jgi:hypothetical protein